MGSAEKILPTVGGGNAGLWWVGVKDSDLRVFDVVMRTPVGTTYNSFLVVSSEHAVLFETVKKPFVNEWLRNIKQALGSASLTHLVVNHTEPDHSGGVSTALAEFPEVSLVATKTALSFLEKQGVQFSGHKTVPVSDRESLTIGSLTLEFHVLPFIHWPDTMITYIPQLKTAITCDFLGSHFCSSTFTLFVEAPHSVDYWNAFKYYFDVIFAPYRLYAKKAVDRIKELDLALVCCSHGPLLKDEILTEGIAKYCLWATPVELERRVVIAFVSAYGFTESLATEIAKGLEAVKVPCKVFDLLKTDFSVVWEEFSHSKGLLLGTPTIERDALGPVWNFATALKPPEHGDRVLGCFGSYGWSGEALANIQQRLKQVRGANVPLEPFAANFALSTSDSSSAVIWGAQFGQAVLGITTTVQPSRPVVLIPKSSDGKTHRWRCKICGEIFIGIEPPETCPVCGASKEEWVIEDLASVTSVASAAVVSTVPPAVPDVEDLESVREKAKEKLKGWCGVYKMCDGDYSKLCQGQSYGRRLGFGGIGSGQSFHNNFLALQAVKLRMSVISLHAEPDCSYNFFGRRLALPVMGAPATGVTR
ncbi:FprA family A-type flavoprotein [Pelomyxa schiedti]|nr:FprA family A-type flavoprotein [Pelomyxa schiedti]